MGGFVIPMDAVQAGDPERVGPKAANLARLACAGLPTPGGYCLTAEAYRRQIAALGLDDLVQRSAQVPPPQARSLAVEIRLALYQGPIAENILDPLMAAWRALRESGPLAVRSSALIEDRAGANFAGQFESFLGLADE